MWIVGLLLDATKTTSTHCGLTAEHVNYMVCFVPFTVLILVTIPVAMAMTPSDKVRLGSGREGHAHFGGDLHARLLVALPSSLVVYFLLVLDNRNT